VGKLNIANLTFSCKGPDTNLRQQKETKHEAVKTEWSTSYIQRANLENPSVLQYLSSPY